MDHGTLAIIFLLTVALFTLVLILVLLFERLPRPPRPTVTGFRIHQLDTRRMHMPIQGIKPGATGTFAETPLPSGTTLPAGVVPAWSSSDSTVTLTPSTDGTTAVAAVPATNSAPSFVLTVSAKLPDGTTPTGSVTVPILQPEVTGFQIDQTA